MFKTRNTLLYTPNLIGPLKMPDGKRGGLAKRQGLVDSRQRIPGRKRGDWQNTRGRGGARQKKGAAR